MIEQAQRIVRVVSVQNRYNVADRQWDDVVTFCESHGLAFLPWFPLAAGALDRSADSARVQSRIAAIAARHGATTMQVALGWLLARSPAMLVIPGTSKVAHLEENVRAAELDLSGEDLD